ncbi:hypothetical protein [Fusibacter sp. JL216-2]|uniref:hypothetical protein n=1 Tax=Fusibacter sp. JL216-2 TaxID=3071453 RepID=UPI003D3529BA
MKLNLSLTNQYGKDDCDFNEIYKTNKKKEINKTLKSNIEIVHTLNSLSVHWKK